MSNSIRLAGELTPRTVAEAFASAEPTKVGHGLAYHQGNLSGTVIGALRKRGFLTPGYGPVDVDGQQRTVSFITDAGHTALRQYRESKK
jgi:hypothetical protein